MACEAVGREQVVDRVGEAAAAGHQDVRLGGVGGQVEGARARVALAQDHDDPVVAEGLGAELGLLGGGRADRQVDVAVNRTPSPPVSQPGTAIAGSNRVQVQPRAMGPSPPFLPLANITTLPMRVLASTRSSRTVPETWLVAPS